ncbi:MAG: hypothetical protein ABI315_12805 [Bacteroidia bacterium]
MEQIIYKIGRSRIIKIAFILCNLCIHNSIAQESNYPTPEEVKAKEEGLEKMGWQTPIGKINSASPLMVTGPMQDCAGAIPVCAQSYTQSSSYSGNGSISEVPTTTCLKSGEKNSVWYIFNTQSAGNFGFTLATAKDYDYALYDITTIGCSGIPSATPTVCNYSGAIGNTGMSSAGSGTSQPAGGNAFCALFSVSAGQTYALIISNYTGDASGYTLTFPSTAGYASITDVTPPTINPPNAITNNCDNTFNITLSEPIKCSSISSDGSDFTISNSGTITAASGIGCDVNGLTSQIQVTYTAPTSRTYTVGIKTGSDGNTLLDNCSNAMSTSQTTTFNHLINLSLTASVSSICVSGSAVTLTTTGANAGGTYTLNPGGVTNTTGIFTVNPTVTTTYIVSVTYGGCTQTATNIVTVISNIVAAISPINPTICSGTTTLTASSLINGSTCSTCTYSWSSGATTNAITVGSGTYTVTVTKPGATCTGSATSTVTLTSGSSSNCNIIYVSPLGVGDGATATTPTSINNALTAAVCNGAIIKMQVGNYPISNKLVVSSYVTLEGGYNIGFTTKTSDMSSGNATTIKRNATPDGGTGLVVTAFEVSPSQTGFRFQDLRIEIADAAAGAKISNYGIKLGASCTTYNIVRCYIDAGQGSD